MSIGCIASISCLNYGWRILVVNDAPRNFHLHRDWITRSAPRKPSSKWFACQKTLNLHGRDMHCWVENSLKFWLSEFYCSWGFFCLQIVNWRNHLKFPEEAKLSPEAKDLISKLLCNVEQRLGTRGAHEIKVWRRDILHFLLVSLMLKIDMNAMSCVNFSHIHGLKVSNGINYIRWRLLSNQRSRMSWTLGTLRNLRR